MGDALTGQVGQPVLRREDPALLTGRGRYVADVALDDPLHLVLVRSAVPSGRIRAVDVARAAALPGVAAVFTGADLRGIGAPSFATPIALGQLPDYSVLADGHVTGLGQPVAAVLADTPARALDAAEAVTVDIDATDPAGGALAEGGWRTPGCAAAFASAALVVEAEMRHPLLAAAPMEPRGIAVAHDPATGALTIWQSTQTPHRTRSELARLLQVDPARLRVIARDVGGAFGMKASLYPEEIVAVWAALRLGRSVRWIATRSEEFLSATLGRGMVSRGRLALDAAGRFLAIEADVTAPLGPWLPNSALVPAWNAGRMLPSGYDLAEVDIRVVARGAPTAPVGIYRGAGRPEAICLIERLVERAAAARAEDPLTLRLRNLLERARLPHDTPTGAHLESGDYPALLRRLADAVGLDALRAERDARRAAGELVGLALTFFVEPTGRGWESARVTLQPDGTAQVASGSSDQGHGRRTVYAQIAADALGLAPGAVTVLAGDTDSCPEGIGALASRSTGIGGSAVLAACRAARARADAGAPLPLSEEVVYTAEGEPWAAGAWCVLLSIDRDTGQPRIERAACIDDLGTVINPRLVAGQIQGGFAQGLGEALMEQVVHDGDGQLLSGSFMDYAMPRAADVPAVEMHGGAGAGPSPLNLIGARGVGEAATIGAPPAILAAALDALAPLGVDDLQMPLTPERLWRAIRSAGGPGAH